MTRQDSVVEAFASVARPVILDFFPPNSCIAASRIAIEVLKAFGIPAIAIPVSVIVEVKARSLVFVSGIDMKGRATVVRSAVNAWPGHVVVWTKFAMIDASFDQFSMPEYGVPIPPFVLTVPLSRAIEPVNVAAELELVTDAGERLHVKYWPLRDWSFKDFPAWETDHLQLAISEIHRQMSESLAQGARLRTAAGKDEGPENLSAPRP